MYTSDTRWRLQLNYQFCFGMEARNYLQNLRDKETHQLISKPYNNLFHLCKKKPTHTLQKLLNKKKHLYTMQQMVKHPISHLTIRRMWKKMRMMRMMKRMLKIMMMEKSQQRRNRKDDTP